MPHRCLLGTAWRVCACVCSKRAWIGTAPADLVIRVPDEDHLGWHEQVRVHDVAKCRLEVPPRGLRPQRDAAAARAAIGQWRRGGNDGEDLGSAGSGGQGVKMKVKSVGDRQITRPSLPS